LESDLGVGRIGNAKDANFYGARADEIIRRWDSTWGFQFYKQDKQGRSNENK
jgi:hypothetical protein